MSKWFAMAVGCSLLAVFDPGASSASPTPDNTPVMKPDDGPKRPGLPIEGVVSNPDWLSRPTGEDVARFYPGLANLLGLSGRVDLHCTVSSLGMMGDCKVVQEAPTGLGFAAAALHMAPLFRMKPETVDGAPVSGSSVNIPISFMMEPAPPESGSAPDAGAGSKAMALARRLAVAARGMSDADFANKYVSALEAQADAMGGSADLDDSTRQAAIDALKSACLAAMPHLMDSTASALVAVYTEDELAKIVEFSESPAGQAWFSKQAQVPAHATANLSEWNKIRQDAVARFCAQRACAPVRKAAATPP